MDRIVMKPNFQEISLAELRTYVLSHREDDSAFYTYVDRVNVEKERVTHPPLNSIEDMENYPEVLEKFRRDPGRKTDPNSTLG
jgi:hypothetical protein